MGVSSYFGCRDREVINGVMVASIGHLGAV